MKHQERLNDLRAELLKMKWKTVAESTGIPYDTVRKIAKGHTEKPAYQDICVLLDYVRETNA